MKAFRFICTLVDAGLRACVDSAASRTLSMTSEKEHRRRATRWRLSVQSSVEVHHAVDFVSLFVPKACALSNCLVVDVAIAARLCSAAPARSSVRSLLGLVSGWDAAVVLAERHEQWLLKPVWSAPTVRRCTIVRRSSACAEALELALRQVGAQVRSLPEASRAGQSHSVFATAQLSQPEREALLRLACDEGACSVSDMCAALGVTRRSLERRFRRLGLPAPAQLIKVLRGGIAS